MTDEKLQALRERVRQELGREMSLDEIGANRQRLRRLLAFNERLAFWQERLDLTEPATVTVLPGGRTE